MPSIFEKLDKIKPAYDILYKVVLFSTSSIFGYCLTMLHVPDLAAQAMMIPRDMELEFTDKGLHVEVGVQSEDIPWRKIVSVTKEYNMVVVRSDAQHGYIITNRMLGKQKDEFWTFVQAKIQKK